MDRVRPTDHGSLRSLRCEACDRVTTHAQGECTGCILRRDNRKVGALWLAIGATIMAVGLVVLLAMSPLIAYPLQPERRRGRFKRYGTAALLFLAGGSVAARGLRGIAQGRSPDA
jgi:hypothetical protein